jgi:hypothetical protein
MKEEKYSRERNEVLVSRGNGWCYQLTRHDFT